MDNYLPSLLESDSFHMSTVDISNLPSILKDQSRRKIILALEQRGPLTYTELLNILDTAHTGRLNYHLKMLGDLIVKDEVSSKYRLSQKGELASQLLTKGFGVNGYAGAGRSMFDIGRVLTIVGAAFLLLATLAPLAASAFLPIPFIPFGLIGIACPIILLAVGTSVNPIASQTRMKRLAVLGILISVVGFLATFDVVSTLTYDIDPLTDLGASISASLGLVLALTGLVLVLSYRSKAAP